VPELKPQRIQIMKNLILSSVLVLIASSAAQAQQAVQWRVEEAGGHPE